MMSQPSRLAFGAGVGEGLRGAHLAELRQRCRPRRCAGADRAAEQRGVAHEHPMCVTTCPLCTISGSFRLSSLKSCGYSSQRSAGRPSRRTSSAIPSPRFSSSRTFHSHLKKFVHSAFTALCSSRIASTTFRAGRLLVVVRSSRKVCHGSPVVRRPDFLQRLKRLVRRGFPFGVLAASAA